MCEASLSYLVFGVWYLKLIPLGFWSLKLGVYPHSFLSHPGTQENTIGCPAHCGGYGGGALGSRDLFRLFRIHLNSGGGTKTPRPDERDGAL